MLPGATSKTMLNKLPRSLSQAIPFLLLLAICWIILAPAQLGGNLIYIIVSGNSMEPNLHNGELAVLRPASYYQVGDVVTYRHPTLGSVIHRIIESKDGIYILQGDNNPWVDSYQPNQQEIVGKLLFHIPNAGKVVKGFRTPVGAALLSGVLSFFLLWPDKDEKEERQRSGSN